MPASKKLCPTDRSIICCSSPYGSATSHLISNMGLRETGCDNERWLKMALVLVQWQHYYERYLSSISTTNDFGTNKMHLRNIFLKMGFDRTGQRLPSMADLHNIIDGKLLVSVTRELVILVEYGDQEYPT